MYTLDDDDTRYVCSKPVDGNSSSRQRLSNQLSVDESDPKISWWGIVFRRMGEVDEEARRARTRRSPGPLPGTALSGNSGADRRLKPRALVGSASPEDLIAARGIALLRLTPVTVPAVGLNAKLAKDVGIPPWELPSLKVISSDTCGISDENTANADSQCQPGAELLSGLETDGDEKNKAEIYIQENHESESVLEFSAELWVRGQQRPDPFLDKVLAGRNASAICFLSLAEKLLSDMSHW